MGDILIIICVLESRFTNVIISYELLVETQMCCKEQHSKNIICEVLTFLFSDFIGCVRSTDTKKG